VTPKSDSGWKFREVGPVFLTRVPAVLEVDLEPSIGARLEGK
jgi:hypothetical protein